MEQYRFDTTQGITGLTQSLEDVQLLLQERRKHASSLDAQTLIEFLVFKCIVLLSNGRYRVLPRLPSGQTIAEAYPELPNVLSTVEASRHLDITVLRNLYQASERYAPSPLCIAPDRAICAMCGKGWTVANCFDCVANAHNEQILLVNFAGMPMHQAQKLLLEQRYPSLSFDPRDGFCRTFVPPCQRAIPTEDLRVVSSGDSLAVTRYSFEHTACRGKRVTRHEQQVIEQLLFAAGFEHQSFTMELVRPDPTTHLFDVPAFLVSTPSIQISIRITGEEICLRWEAVDSGKPNEALACLVNPFTVKASSPSVIEWLSLLRKTCRPTEQAAAAP